MHSPDDEKWLQALRDTYEVEGALLPYFSNPDGSVNAVETLQGFCNLQGIKLSNSGRIIRS